MYTLTAQLRNGRTWQQSAPSIMELQRIASKLKSATGTYRITCRFSGEVIYQQSHNLGA